MDRGYSECSRFPEAIVRIAENWDVKLFGTRREPPIRIDDEEQKPGGGNKRAAARRCSIGELGASLPIGKERPILSRRASTSAVAKQGFL